MANCCRFCKTSDNLVSYNFLDSHHTLREFHVCADCRELIMYISLHLTDVEYKLDKLSERLDYVEHRGD